MGNHMQWDMHVWETFHRLPIREAVAEIPGWGKLHSSLFVGVLCNHLRGVVVDF